MAIEEKSIFGGFDLLADALNPTKSGEGVIPNDDNAIDIDPSELEIDENEEEEIEETELEEEEETEEIPLKPKKKEVESTPEEEEDEDIEESEDVAELGELEPDIAAFFQERLAEELGWEFGEDEKFASVADAVEYMGKIVEEASKPKYANDEVAAFDEFVRNGGNLRDFYSSNIDGKLDLTNIDLEDENHQKLVVREYLKEQGLKDAIIEKRISRYADTGVLAEEAEEALPILEEKRENDKVKLLEEQKKIKQAQEQQQREFLNSVQSTVKDLKNIRGVGINESEKKELLDYIFKPTNDGRTQYQKDYMSDIKNLIESAYFTKKGDVLIDRAKKKAASETALDLKKKISAKKGNRLSGKDSQNDGSSSIGFGSLSNMLLKKV